MVLLQAAGGITAHNLLTCRGWPQGNLCICIPAPGNIWLSGSPLPCPCSVGQRYCFLPSAITMQLPTSGFRFPFQGIRAAGLQRAVLWWGSRQGRRWQEPFGLLACCLSEPGVRSMCLNSSAGGTGLPMIINLLLWKIWLIYAHDLKTSWYLLCTSGLILQ